MVTIAFTTRDFHSKDCTHAGHTPDGNLWLAEFGGQNIGKITASGTITEYSSTGGYPYFICAGPDGNLWFTENSANKIAKVTTSGAITKYAIPTSNSQPRSICAGSDGNLWFAEQNGNKIGNLLLV